jgi:hypothetical protein
MRDNSSAAVRPVGPAPAIKTGSVMTSLRIDAYVIRWARRNADFCSPFAASVGTRHASSIDPRLPWAKSESEMGMAAEAFRAMWLRVRIEMENATPDNGDVRRASRVGTELVYQTQR